MTDSQKEPGITPDQPADAGAFTGDASGEAIAPAADETAAAAVPPVEPQAVQPTDAQPTDAQPTDAQPADAQPTDAQPADAQPADVPPVGAHAAGAPAESTPANATDANATDAFPADARATDAYPTDASPADARATDAYPTDAFGRPLAGAAASESAYAPNVAPPSYAGGNGYPTQPLGPRLKDPARRKGSVALIAALAIGALVGGASGAGVTALVLSGQNSGSPASQAQGPSNVVVNNTKSVNEITAVAAKASPSVVTIDVKSGEQGGTGSGVILTDDGYVLTNTHVVTLDGAVADAAIQVKGSDGTLYKATVVGTDPISDLAVIKLTDAKGLTPITWADSAKLNVGDTAIAIGAPLGLSGTVTNGIVSALNRSITIASSAAPTTPDETTPNEGDGSNPFDFWNFDLPKEDGSQSQAAPKGSSSISLPVIQTDAAINPGNSGGALLNGQGELIGINVAIANAGGTSTTAAGSIGVGFSIPSNLAKRISDELIADGKATHGLLGASVTNATSDDDSSTVGALISEVTSGGAAQKAGLQKGDVVTNFNGVPITDANDLTAQVRVLAAGEKADLTYVRDGKSVTISVTVGELSS